MHAGFDGTTAPSMVPTNVAVSQREKRRFYVKKSIIGMQEFRDWEEKLGDYWYRHHHKVNNIVYYHCKYEPCYASMKAKVMLDCVQLYVTEEGHSHPAPADMMAPPSKHVMDPLTRQTVSVQKRKHMDEQYYTGFSAAPYPQQFLNDILRMQGDFNGVHDASAAACYSNPHLAFQNGEASKEGIEIKMENQGATTSDMRMEVISAVAEVAKYAQNRTAQMENNSQKGADGTGTVQQVSKPISAHSTTSPISSPEVHPSGNSNQVQQRNGFSDESDSDDDESSDTESDDAKCSSSHAGQKCGGGDVETDNDLFAILKKKIERQVPRKRLRYLRRIRRQLSYFLQMHEVKEMSSRLPPATKYEDIFGKHQQQQQQQPHQHQQQQQQQQQSQQ
ncbi:hypothetical protein WUBG_05125 [Wuchereria bancrofti]|uniref:WRKY domain-containing protein n=1 Tax=Wuchereria bancrofti TaxID=6293 RepID=J9BA44_WUCBA|nr:hypothetical protein WUBG_05125 [Wuchereria bancrofti]